MDFQNLVKVEHNDQLVLTTEQLAEFYESKIDNIKVNFNSNKEHFLAGKHYFKRQLPATKVAGLRGETSNCLDTANLLIKQ